MPPIQCSPSNTTYYEGLKEKVEEFSKIARHYSIQVIDAYHECGICGEFEGGRWLGSDGLHPNVNGASLLADYVSKELRKNFF
jgi:lysophospholipase L1-like esterase